MLPKKIIIIAGPNGAGKTTFADIFLPNEAACPNFLNADLIAANLKPLNLISDVINLRAGQLMLGIMDDLSGAGISFALETTLSGKGYVRRIRKWQSLGYFVSLFFLQLESAENAIDRVAKRVREGGHNIPEDVIRRRFLAGRKNFDILYKDIVDEWALYDSSCTPPQLIDEGNKLQL